MGNRKRMTVFKKTHKGQSLGASVEHAVFSNLNSGHQHSLQLRDSISVNKRKRDTLRKHVEQNAAMHQQLIANMGGKHNMSSPVSRNGSSHAKDATNWIQRATTTRINQRNNLADAFDIKPNELDDFKKLKLRIETSNNPIFIHPNDRHSKPPSRTPSLAALSRQGSLKPNQLFTTPQSNSRRNSVFEEMRRHSMRPHVMPPVPQNSTNQINANTMHPTVQMILAVFETLPTAQRREVLHTLNDMQPQN